MTDYPDSYYSASRNLDLAGTERLDGRERADVCVVGGGLTGCSAALHLAERGYSVRLLEARRIGWGASGRSGGQIIPGLPTDLAQFHRTLGHEAVRAIWEMTREAVDLVRQRVADHRIDCDLKWGYVHAATKARQMYELETRLTDLSRDFGYDDMYLLDRQALMRHVGTSCYVGGTYQKDAGHLHPLNYTLGMANAAQDAGARLHEDSRVTAIDRGGKAVVRTDRGEVEADFVLLCGNAYLDRLVPEIAPTIMPVGTHILATEPLSEAQVAQVLPRDDAVVTLKFVLDYYRLAADRRMLFGGRVSYSARQPIDLEAVMRRRMSCVFPQLAHARADYAWGGFVGITRNRAPHFGRIDSNMLFAHGFSGHGMALTGLAGKLMAEAVAGQAERFGLFSRITHKDFPGGPVFRMPLLVLAMTYYRIRDLL